MGLAEVLSAAVDEGAALVPVMDIDPASIALLLVPGLDSVSVCALTAVVGAGLVLLLTLLLVLEVVFAAESRVTKANVSWISSSSLMSRRKSPKPSFTPSPYTIPHQIR